VEYLRSGISISTAVRTSNPKVVEVVYGFVQPFSVLAIVVHQIRLWILYSTLFAVY
jgi:hypothetical protein